MKWHFPKQVDENLAFTLIKSWQTFQGFFFIDCEIMFANATLSKINMVGTAIVHIKINNRFMGHILFFSKFWRKNT